MGCSSNPKVEDNNKNQIGDYDERDNFYYFINRNNKHPLPPSKYSPNRNPKINNDEKIEEIKSDEISEEKNNIKNNNKNTQNQSYYSDSGENENNNGDLYTNRKENDRNNNNNDEDEGDDNDGDENNHKNKRNKNKKNNNTIHDNSEENNTKKGKNKKNKRNKNANDDDYDDDNDDNDDNDEDEEDDDNSNENVEDYKDIFSEKGKKIPNYKDYKEGLDNKKKNKNLKKSKINGITIVQDLKNYFPEDITKEEIRNLVFEAFGDLIVDDISLYIPGQTVTFEQATELSNYVYNFIKNKKNTNDECLEELNVKIDLVPLNKKLIKEKMFKGQEPSEKQLEDIYQSYGGESNTIKVLTIEFK